MVWRDAINSLRSLQVLPLVTHNISAWQHLLSKTRSDWSFQITGKLMLSKARLCRLSAKISCSTWSKSVLKEEKQWHLANFQLRQRQTSTSTIEYSIMSLKLATKTDTSKHNLAYQLLTWISNFLSPSKCPWLTLRKLWKIKILRWSMRFKKTYFVSNRLNMVSLLIKVVSEDWVFVAAMASLSNVVEIKSVIAMGLALICLNLFLEVNTLSEFSLKFYLT